MIFLWPKILKFVWPLNIKLWTMRTMILKLKVCNNLWAPDRMGYRSWIWNVHWMLNFKIRSNWALLTSSWLQLVTHFSPFMSITLFQDLSLWAMTLHIWIWCKVVKLWFATCFVHWWRLESILNFLLHFDCL
jgi:hypothetical protein